jgi:hypothetical protein
MVNLQDTPRGGPLTADDLARYRAMHRAYIPAGCDQQGRHPQAAEACTDLGADDNLACAGGMVRAVLWCLALYAVGITAWVLLS